MKKAKVQIENELKSLEDESSLIRNLKVKINLYFHKVRKRFVKNHHPFPSDMMSFISYTKLQMLKVFIVEIGKIRFLFSKIINWINFGKEGFKTGTKLYFSVFSVKFSINFWKHNIPSYFYLERKRGVTGWERKKTGRTPTNRSGH